MTDLPTTHPELLRPNAAASSPVWAKFAALPRVCAFLAVFVSVVVLLAWQFHAYALVTLFPGRPAMAQSTATALLLLGISLGLSSAGKRQGAEGPASKLFALAALLIGCGVLVRYVISLLGHTLPASAPAVSGSGSVMPVNLMSPNSAVNIVLLGLALLLADVRGWRDRWPAQALGLIVLLDALVALIGQLYGITFFYGLSPFVGTAVHTAALFLLLSCGILLSHPDRGFVAVLFAGDAAGRAARRFLPLAFVAPVLLGAVGFLSLRLHRVDAPFLVYLVVIVSVGVLGWLVWGSVLALRAQVRQSATYERQIADMERSHVEHALQESEDARSVSEERLRVLFETMTQAVVYQDADGILTAANPAAERILGLTLSEMTGRISSDPRWQAIRPDGTALPGEEHPPMLALTIGRPILGVVMGVVNPARSETRWLRVNSLPQFRAGEERPYQVYSLFEDITEECLAATERKNAAMRQRAFLRDVLASVTEGRLILCQLPEELPSPLQSIFEPIPLSQATGLRELREVVREACQSIGLSEERCYDLMTAASEAGMNAIVHGGGGVGHVSLTEAGKVQVRVEDHGGGISMENLPRATLARGFSTKATLGHGLKMMLETIDRLYLLTGTEGTLVVIEQERDPPFPVWLSDALDNKPPTI